MLIQRLDINAVRNIDAARLDELGRINLFYGVNGSGKTSVLEAIHVLCLGRSFRSRQFRSVIQDGKEHATVFARAFDPVSLRKTSIGVNRSRNNPPEIRRDGNPVSVLAELAELFPLQLLNADSFELIEGGPLKRRQFLDWGVFHVEHGFISHWQAVKKCIRQRNLLLRRGKIRDSDLAAWDHELAVNGTLVDEARKRYFDEFKTEFAPIAERITGLSRISLDYSRGWDKDKSLVQALDERREQDLQLGHTGPGPHRAELRVKVAGKLAADVLSRGQIKILVCALRLAQASLLKKLNNKECMFLIDDLSAELDVQYRQRLCSEIERLHAQAFVTCIEPESVVSLWSENSAMKMFHVEQGGVEPVLN